MITQIRSSANWTDTLKARNNHLTTLLKIVDIKTEKATAVQLLTVDLIKAEMNRIESQLKDRN